MASNGRVSIGWTIGVVVATTTLALVFLMYLSHAIALRNSDWRVFLFRNVPATRSTYIPCLLEYAAPDSIPEVLELLNGVTNSLVMTKAVWQIGNTKKKGMYPYLDALLYEDSGVPEHIRRVVLQVLAANSITSRLDLVIQLAEGQNKAVSQEAVATLRTWADEGLVESGVVDQVYGSIEVIH